MSKGIGQLRCVAVDVNDLGIGERFWSALTGLPVIPSIFPGRYSYLGQADPWRHELILHLVDRPKGDDANRCHVDIWVRDIDAAIEQIEAIGGRVKQPPSIYPRPHTYPEPPTLDWAVLQDPFGNEFCLVSVLTADEARAVTAAGEQSAPHDDVHWRTVAGRTR